MEIASPYWPCTKNTVSVRVTGLEAWPVPLAEDPLDAAITMA